MSKATVVQNSPIINTSIDMKLSMKDIIEIAINEQQESLELRIEELDKEAKATVDKYNDIRLAFYKKISAPLLKKVKKSFDEKVKLDMSQCRNYRYSAHSHLNNICEDTESLVMMVEISSDDLRFKQYVALNDNQKATMKQARDEHNAVIKEFIFTTRELENLTKKSSRAKASLIKQMLATSEEGKQLLNQLKIVKTALLPAK